MRRQMEELSTLRTAANVSVTQLEELHAHLGQEQRKVIRGEQPIICVFRLWSHSFLIVFLCILLLVAVSK